MNREELTQIVLSLYEMTEGNVVTKGMGSSPDLIGLKFYEPPVIGIGDAEDELFRIFKRPDVIGPWHMLPEEWLSGAESVVSLFFPFTEPVRRSNVGGEYPSEEWLFARMEGEDYLNAFIQSLKEWFESQDIKACVPSVDARYQGYRCGKGLEDYPETTEATFGSRWSERHAAYVCGLGTFGLSKGLITEKGMAGRFTSIIISKKLPADTRNYNGIYDYCIRCGACIRVCPVNAISLESGKDHTLCDHWLRKMGEKFAPRYACGKCQAGVPCEAAIPLG